MKLTSKSISVPRLTGGGGKHFFRRIRWAGF